MLTSLLIRAYPTYYRPCANVPLDPIDPCAANPARATQAELLCHKYLYQVNNCFTQVRYIDIMNITSTLHIYYISALHMSIMYITSAIQLGHNPLTALCYILQLLTTTSNIKHGTLFKPWCKRTNPQVPFTSCHSVVDPVMFYENCKSDFCGSEWRRDDNLPLCNVLSAYAASCSLRVRRKGHGHQGFEPSSSVYFHDLNPSSYI